MTPVTNTVVVAVVVSLLAGFVPLDKLADLVSIGTLTAFIVVSIGSSSCAYGSRICPVASGFPATR